MTNLTLDLMLLARYLLVPKGRLVFFLPTVTEDWDSVDLPTVEGMSEIRFAEGSVQEFGKWGRRVGCEFAVFDNCPLALPSRFDAKIVPVLTRS